VPLIRLRRNFDFGMGSNASDFMLLENLGYDGKAYNYEWRGPRGILPLDVFARAFNQDIQGKELRYLWIAGDAPNENFWDNQDRVLIMTSRFGSRMGLGMAIPHVVSRVGVMNAYDTIGLNIRPKNDAYDVTLLVSPITDDIGSSEYRINTT